MTNYDNFQLLCLRFLGDRGDIRASNIYMSSQSSLQPIIDKYEDRNITRNFYNPILELVIHAPPPDNDDRFEIVNLDGGPPPPPPPEGGSNRIPLLKVTLEQLDVVVERNINPLLIKKISDLFQINIKEEDIKKFIESIKQNLKTGGKTRFGKSSSRPRGRRSSKKRGTQRKQKRRQRRGSRRA